MNIEKINYIIKQLSLLKLPKLLIIDFFLLNILLLLVNLPKIFNIIRDNSLFLILYVMLIIIYMVLVVVFNMHNILNILYCYNSIDFRIIWKIITNKPLPLVKNIEYSKTISNTIENDKINIFKITDNFSFFLYGNTCDNNFVNGNVKKLQNSLCIKDALFYKTEVGNEIYVIMVLPKNIFNILTKLDIKTNNTNLLISTYSDTFDEKIVQHYSDISYADKTKSYNSTTVILGISNIDNKQLSKLKLMI